MKPTDMDRTDFRAAAVAASESLLDGLSNGLPPEESGNSCCLVRQPDLSRLRRSIKICVAVCAVVGLSGVTIGGVTCLLVSKHLIPESPSLLTIALCCCVGGILTLAIPTFFERRIVRDRLAPTDESFVAGFGPAGVHVSVEDARSYSSMKFLAEDVGLLYVHPREHYVKIDGLSFQYVIQAKDVISLSLHANRKTTLLTYAIGQERLQLAIIPRSLWAEFKRQTAGSSRSLFTKIDEALRV
jgi:hypothetical protein